jgi:hypothetical protein
MHSPRPIFSCSRVSASIQALFEASFFEGLRKAGMPEKRSPPQSPAQLQDLLDPTRSEIKRRLLGEFYHGAKT